MRNEVMAANDAKVSRDGALRRMKPHPRNRRSWSGAPLVALAFATACSSQRPSVLVPEQGYAWPATMREYWPTEGWKSAPPQEHGIDSTRLARADAFARSDPLSRSLLVVKDG